MPPKKSSPKSKASEKQPTDNSKAVKASDKQAEKAPKITLFSHPIKALFILSKILLRFLRKCLYYLLNHWLIAILVVSLVLVPRKVPGPHSEVVFWVEEIVVFVIWWVGLGVASSIGLGTGLHTFLLYLGPHIAKVTMVANECGVIPRMFPSRWNFQTFDECTPSASHEGLSFLEILIAVQIESFLWGLGTAIGELPPYYVARAASLANQSNDEIEEIEELLHDKKPTDLMGRIKRWMVANLQHYAFGTVMLMASIPNPLFDLAGITCGHFLIPFSTFFFATFIGKAIFKVHIQMTFVIFVFTKHHVEVVLRFLENNIPFLTNKLTEVVENQKKMLHSPQNYVEGKKPLIGQLWDYFILAMVVFFLVSIGNSLITQYQHEKDAKERNDKKKAKKSE